MSEPKSQAPLEISGKGWRVAMPAMVVLTLASAIGTWVKPATDISKLEMAQQIRDLRDEQFRIEVRNELAAIKAGGERLSDDTKNRLSIIEERVERIRRAQGSVSP